MSARKCSVCVNKMQLELETHPYDEKLRRDTRTTRIAANPIVDKRRDKDQLRIAATRVLGYVHLI